jgi:hypothetical protein
LIPPAAGVALADDKLTFNNWLIDTGFGYCVPKMLNSTNLTFPLIRKKRIDEWGLHSRIFLCEEELRCVDINDLSYFMQECISDREEYVTHLICISGVITYAVTLVNLHHGPLYIKGAGEQPIKVKNIGGFVPPELSAILKIMDYSGCACFNYKVIDGALFIFELNPRVGGSFTRVTDQYLEAYFESVRWSQKRETT